MVTTTIATRLNAPASANGFGSFVFAPRVDIVPTRLSGGEVRRGETDPARGMADLVGGLVGVDPLPGPSTEDGGPLHRALRPDGEGRSVPPMLPPMQPPVLAGFAARLAAHAVAPRDGIDRRYGKGLAARANDGFPAMAETDAATGLPEPRRPGHRGRDVRLRRIGLSERGDG